MSRGFDGFEIDDFRDSGFDSGRYWRFRQDEVLAWVERQQGGQHVA
jgi:hypothetical protein